VALLAWNSLRIIREESKFERTIKPGELKLLAVAQRDNTVVDVAGASSENFYFQTQAPDKIIVMDKGLKKSRPLALKFTPEKRMSSFFFCSVDSPNVDIRACNSRAVVSGTLDENLTIRFLPSKIFTRAVKISNDSYILRGFDSTVKSLDQIFLKVNAKTGVMQREKAVSERRNDGGISTDGKLLYDEKTSLLLYIHHFSNKIKCLDTNLNLVYESKTLGTANGSEPNAISVSSTGKITNASPKRIVNNDSYAVNGLLFNQSKMISKGERDNNAISGSPIDIYDMKTGEYKESFYIPYIKGQTANRFKIFGNILIALSKDYVATFQLAY
jgi:hypothetical protein